jgi:hypothetical protein
MAEDTSNANHLTISHLRKAVAHDPGVKDLLLPIPLGDQVAESLATLPELTHVDTDAVVLSESGARMLCGSESLKLLLVENLDDETADRFIKHMPELEIRRDGDHNPTGR